VSGSFSVFSHQFRGYVFQEPVLTDLIPQRNNPDGLRVLQYVSQDATFRGSELELRFHLLSGEMRRQDLEFSADSVRATTDHPAQNLPRIPASHRAVKVIYRGRRVGWND
jgi:hypothetical protein